eukprot:1146478-Pelagomonas_calceolata.AAC.8
MGTGDACMASVCNSVQSISDVCMQPKAGTASSAVLGSLYSGSHPALCSSKGGFNNTFPSIRQRRLQVRDIKYQKAIKGPSVFAACLRLLLCGMFNHRLAVCWFSRMRVLNAYSRNPG